MSTFHDALRPWISALVRMFGWPFIRSGAVERSVEEAGRTRTIQAVLIWTLVWAACCLPVLGATLMGDCEGKACLVSKHAAFSHAAMVALGVYVLGLVVTARRPR